MKDNIPELKKFLKEKEIDYREEVPVSHFTTYRIGGVCHVMVFPSSMEETTRVIRRTGEMGLSRKVLGGGSNVLANDGYIQSVIVASRGLKLLRRENEKIHAGAGLPVNYLSRFCAGEGLSGMEFAGGLPGSLGGAVFMNARCYGGEIGRVVERVVCLDEEGRVRMLSNAECRFAYKDSIFQRERLFITEVVLKLKKGDEKKLLETTKDNEKDRISKGQYDYPSCGCVFKNNYSLGIPSGKIIEDLGLKGEKMGGIMISPKHGNFFINLGEGKAEDVKKLIETVQKKVHERHGVYLEEEVCHVQ